MFPKFLLKFNFLLIFFKNCIKTYPTFLMFNIILMKFWILQSLGTTNKIVKKVYSPPLVSIIFLEKFHSVVLFIKRGWNFYESTCIIRKYVHINTLPMPQRKFFCGIKDRSLWSPPFGMSLGSSFEHISYC